MFCFHKHEPKQQWRHALQDASKTKVTRAQPGGPEGTLGWHWQSSADPSRYKRLNQSSSGPAQLSQNASGWKNCPAGWEIQKSGRVSACDVIFTLQAVLIEPPPTPPPPPTHNPPHHKGSPCLSAGWRIWRRKSGRSAVKSASYQRGRVRNSAALSCSQQPAVSHLELLTTTTTTTSQIIWQAKWDDFIRSSTPSRVGAPRVLGERALSHGKHQPLPPPLPPHPPPPPSPPSISAFTLQCLPHSFPLRTQQWVVNNLKSAPQ